MMLLPLQVTRAASPLRVYIVVLTFLLSAVFGAFIAYKAYRGYKRNESGPMLYFALGVVLITAIPTFLSLVLTNMTDLPGYLVVITTNLTELLGLGAIAYALYGDF